MGPSIWAVYVTWINLTASDSRIPPPISEGPRMELFRGVFVGLAIGLFALSGVAIRRELNALPRQNRANGDDSFARPFAEIAPRPGERGD